MKIRLRKSIVFSIGVILLIACSNPQTSPNTQSAQKKPPRERAKPPTQLEYLPARSTQPTTSPTASSKQLTANQPTDDFSAETVGAQPTSFAPAVGNWIIGIDSNNQVLVVDGRGWEKGKTSTGLVEQARTLYGDRYAEFLGNVKAYAYFPFAVAKNIPDFQQGEIILRFKAIDGKIDQAAGIIFNLKPNGDYLVVRANSLENNLVLFKYEKGKRSSVSWIQNVPTSTRQWHDLKIKIDGTQIQGYLDAVLHLKYDLPTPVSGKVGVWSKADSVVYFDDFIVKEK